MRAAQIARQLNPRRTWAAAMFLVPPHGFWALCSRKRHGPDNIQPASELRKSKRAVDVATQVKPAY